MSIPAGLQRQLDEVAMLQTCPFCGNHACEADFVDVGVGQFGVQCGPYHCTECGASEIGPEREDPGFDATEEEVRVGWYRDRISPYANTVEGRLVDHKTAKQAYRDGRLDKKEINRG